MSGHACSSQQGRFQSKKKMVSTIKPAHSHVDIIFYLPATVQTCDPEELMHNLLEPIKDIQPGKISETILAALQHLQTGINRGGKTHISPTCARNKILKKQPKPYKYY